MNKSTNLLRQRLKLTFMPVLMFSGLMVASLALNGCASLSEDQCASGNWLERGYKDGIKGASSSKISKYADTCSEYGFQVNRSAYLRGHEEGVERYCTYETGFARGESGSDFNPVCADGIGDGFAQGYDAGRERYALRQTYNSLINDYTTAKDRLSGIRSRLSETDLTREDLKRLRKKEARTEIQIEDIQIEIRAFERIYDVGRYSFWSE